MLFLNEEVVILPSLAPCAINTLSAVLLIKLLPVISYLLRISKIDPVFATLLLKTELEIVIVNASSPLKALEEITLAFLIKLEPLI